MTDQTNPTQPDDDNLQAATDQNNPTPTINNQLDPDKPAQKQILIRATDNEHARWKQAATHHNTTLSNYIRQIVNQYTNETLDCTHPINMRRWYPWAEFCNQCGQRLRG